MESKTCMACGFLPICGVGGYRARHPECPTCADWRPKGDPEAAFLVEERARRVREEVRRGR